MIWMNVLENLYEQHVRESTLMKNAFDIISGTTSIDSSEEQSDSENKSMLAEKWSDNIWTTSPKKGIWEAFIVAWYTCQFPFQRL